jgi:hypothetical protein
MGSNLSGIFDSTKRYSNLDFQKSQFVAPTDWDHMQDILDFDSEGKAVFNTGVGLKINAITNSPLLKIRANNDISDGCILTFEMTGINNVKWRKNGGAWSGAIVVVTDGVTWNESVGTSGLDIIFTDTAVALDSSEVWVGRGIRLLGGKLEHSAGLTYKLNEGKWLLEGKYVELADDTVAGCNNGDYVYLKVTETTVTHAVDTDIGHYTVDGQYADKSPIATKREYDLLASAVFPSPTVSPYARYVVVGKIINAAGGTFTSMWDTALDMQQIYRLLDDTAPDTPTGLTLSTGAENDLITSTPGTIVSRTDALGYLTMGVATPSEPDLDYHEFKIVRLDIAHNPTTDVRNIPVKLNIDDGGVGIPVGINYTEHNLTIGIEYRVFCRATDYAGNVSSWCAGADQVISGPCSIAVGDASPTISLDDTNNFVGFKLNVTVVPVGTDGFTVWVGEGAYPIIANNEGLVGSYPANTGFVNIPWKESGQPYVSVVAYDSNRFYHVDGVGALKVSQDNISLASSAQLHTETHNQDTASHGGIVGDILSCQQKYGSVHKWLDLLSNQGFDLKNIYIVAESGANYSSVQSALNAIESDAPPWALILLAPGWYDGATTITFPNLEVGGILTTRITIQGLGSKLCVIDADIDISTLSTSPNPISAPLFTGIAGLTLRDIRVEGRIYGIKTAVPLGMLVLDNVIVMDSSSVNSLIKLDASAGGGFYSYIYNSYLINFGTQPVIEYLGHNDFNIEGTTLNQYSGGVVDA